MALVELQVHALDEDLRRPAPLRAPGGSPRRSINRLAISTERSARSFGLSPGREEHPQRVAFEAAEAFEAVNSRTGVRSPQDHGGGAAAAASETTARSRTTMVPAPRSPRRRVWGWKSMTTIPIKTTSTSTTRMTFRTATAPKSTA